MVINARDFVQILYFALETKMFTIVKYFRISLLVWALFHKIIKCI